MAKVSSKWLALLGSVVIGAASAVHAQDSGPLVDLLLKKGIVTDQEAEDLRAELTKDFANNSAAGKLNLSPALTEFRISGDVRVRYEYRAGENATGDHTERERWRYRLRPTFTGRLGSQWMYGFRFENSAKSRSSNVTMGGDQGPFAKTDDAVNIGQVYIGWMPTNEITVFAGRMPNPFYSTLMVWDADINPEGFAEQYKTRVGQFEYMATLGQFVYDSANPQNVFGSTGNKNDQYLFGWQASFKYYVPETTTDFFQIAPTLYNYVNNNSASKNFAGAFSSTNPVAINNLLILDVPLEYNWTMGGVLMRVFGDYAHNFDADQRATKYGRPDLKNQDNAYQIGYQYGKAKLKGEWDARVFYQSTDLFALDQNLIDSDLFDSRVNMKGVVFVFDYQITDAVNATLTYANGKRKNTGDLSLGATGEPDLGGTILSKYNLFQADIVVKF